MLPYDNLHNEDPLDTTDQWLAKEEALLEEQSYTTSLPMSGSANNEGLPAAIASIGSNGSRLGMRSTSEIRMQ